MKALVGVFNQEKALVGAFSVIVKTGCGTDGPLHSTSPDYPHLSLVRQGFWAAGGFRNIYSGLGPAAVGSAPNAAIFFCTYDTVKRVAVTQLGCQVLGANCHYCHYLY